MTVNSITSNSPTPAPKAQPAPPVSPARSSQPTTGPGSGAPTTMAGPASASPAQIRSQGPAANPTTAFATTGGQTGPGGPAGGGLVPPADAQRAAVLVTAYSSGGVVTEVDTAGLAKHVASLAKDSPNNGKDLVGAVANRLRGEDRAAFQQQVDAEIDDQNGFFSRATDWAGDAVDWVKAKPGEFREWHDGYRPEGVGGHALDAVSTLGVGVLDIAEFAGNVGGTLSDLSPLGQAVETIEKIWGKELPGWLPNSGRGRENLAAAADAVKNIAQNPRAIWDGLSEPYTKLWAEERYGGLVGQVVADFGDILLGSKGAGKAGGALADLAKLGKLNDVDAISDVLTAARRADTAIPNEFTKVADELVELKRADGSLDQVIEAARRTDTLPDLLGRGILKKAEIDDLVKTGKVSVDEAAKARLPVSGAKYIESYATVDEIKAYDNIAARVDDVAKIADNLGVEQKVVDRVKSHLFLEKHQVPVGPNDLRTGHFTPDGDIAEVWSKAADGTLSASEAKAFKGLLSHEYVESSLMQAGLPYRSANPAAWDAAEGFAKPPTAEHYGAHDLAPLAHADRPPFAHWSGSFGKSGPGVEIASDLSNLDGLVREILENLP